MAVKPRKKSMSDDEIYQWMYEEKIVINQEAGCHEWQGYRDKNDYGIFYYLGNPQRVHRWIFAYTEELKELTEDQYILHRCDNPCCCNPEHLFLGDNDLNVKDMMIKGRQRKGEQIGNSKLKDYQAEEIRNLLKEGKLTQLKIAKMYGIRQTTISKIKLGQIRNV